MIWLAWRHIRTQALVLFAVLIALVLTLRVASAHQRHQFAFVDACIRNGCSNFSWTNTFPEELVGHYLGQVLIYALPVLTGMFWGAPLVARELSSGTARTAWTQSVTRTKWLGARLALTGTASVAATALVSLSANWWFTPFSNFSSESRFDPAVFDVHGVAPIGYAALGFALGVLSGAIWRRALPAMITTLVAFVAARFAVTQWIRPNFQAHRTIVESVNSLNAQLASGSAYGAPALTPNVNDWITSNRVLEPSGRPYNIAKTYCDGNVLGSGGCNARTQAYIDKLHVVIKYQPANRYWPFQIYETLTYSVAAALLIGVTFWLVRRRNV